MSQISRLKSAQIQNGNLINADDINSELNQQVNESNSQDSRLSTIESGAFNQTGTLSTTNNILTNGLSERSTGVGILVDSTRLQDGYANLQAVLATVSSVDIINDALVFSSNHTITTGSPVRIRVLAGGALPSGIFNNTTYYALAVSTTTLKLYTTAANAITAGSTGLIDITATGTGSIQVIGTPSTLQEGDVFVNATGLNVYLNNSSKTIMENAGLPLPRNYSKSSVPCYITPTTFTVASIQERSSDDTANIIKFTSTTLDITSIGLNGIAQSSNLTGTVTVTAGSTALTFSSTQAGILQAGDVILTASGQARKLTSVSGTTATAESQFTTTETGVSFKRGARPGFYTANSSGSVGSVFFYLYAISDSVTPGLILSTRNVAAGDSLVDLPIGYSQVRQLTFAVTLYNTSTAAGVYVGNIVPFRIGAGWPTRPEIFYEVNATISSATPGDTNVLSNGTAITATTVDASLWIPRISRLLIPNLLSNGRPSSYVLRETGTTAYPLTCGDFNGGNAFQSRNLGVNANGQFDYKGFSVTGPLYVDVMGYVVTEV